MLRTVGRRFDPKSVLGVLSKDTTVVVEAIPSVVTDGTNREILQVLATEWRRSSLQCLPVVARSLPA